MRYRIGSLKINYMFLIYSIIGISCIAPLLKDLNSSATIISYIPDVLNVLLFILAIVKKNKKSREFSHSIIFLWIFFLIIFDISELFIFRQNIFLFLWGVRNQYRFILFFVSCVILCNNSDLDKIDSFFRKLLLINFAVVFVEFLFGYMQDCLSGTFGITAGSNGSANLFLSVCFTSLLIDYVYKKIKKSEMLFYGVGIFLWAALAELKYFIVLAAIMVIICLMITQRKKINSRAFEISIFAIIGGISCILLLEYVRPYYKDFFRLDSLIWYAKHVDMGVGGFGRLTAVPLTNKLFFNNKLSRIIFGIGLGSAEYSSIAIFDSPFHKLFGAYNYDTLFYAITYIERGVLGLTWYFLFYLSSLNKSLFSKKVSTDDEIMLKKNIICIVIAFFVSFYDDSLRRASGGYVMFFLLAIPYVISKEYSIKKK